MCFQKILLVTLNFQSLVLYDAFFSQFKWCWWHSQNVGKKAWLLSFLLQFCMWLNAHIILFFMHEFVYFYVVFTYNMYMKGCLHVNYQDYNYIPKTKITLCCFVKGFCFHQSYNLNLWKYMINSCRKYNSRAWSFYM